MRISLLALFLLIAACGQQGALYLPAPEPNKAADAAKNQPAADEDSEADEAEPASKPTTND